MKTRNNSFYKIDSFRSLEAEKTRVYYEVKLSRQKINLALLELRMLTRGERILTSLLPGMLTPLTGLLKQWYRRFMHESDPGTAKPGDVK